MPPLYWSREYRARLLVNRLPCRSRYPTQRLLPRRQDCTKSATALVSTLTHLVSTLMHDGPNQDANSDRHKELPQSQPQGHQNSWELGKGTHNET